MKKLLQGAVLPFVIFISGMLLLGCNQAAEQSRQQDDAQAIETAQMSENTSDSNNNNQSTANKVAIAASVATTVSTTVILGALAKNRFNS